MRSAEKSRPDRVTIAPIGRVDDKESQNMALKLSSLDLGAIKEVVFDLNQVTSLTSRAIGQIIAFYKKAAPQNVEVKLVNASTDLYSMLHMLKLDRIVSITARE